MCGELYYSFEYTGEGGKAGGWEGGGGREREKKKGEREGRGRRREGGEGEKREGGRRTGGGKEGASDGGPYMLCGDLCGELYYSFEYIGEGGRGGGGVKGEGKGNCCVCCKFTFSVRMRIMPSL